MVSPTLTRSMFASRVPMAMPLPSPKPLSVPKRMLSAMSGSAFSPSSVMPRTSAPVACTADETMTWPSMSGSTTLTPGTVATRLRHRVVVVERPADLVDDDVAVEPEDLGEQLVAEAVHHRHDDDEGGDAQHDAGEREAGDDGDEAFLAARPQVAARDHPLVGGERPRAVGRVHTRCDRCGARHPGIAPVMNSPPRQGLDRAHASRAPSPSAPWARNTWWKMWPTPVPRAETRYQR